nr:MAG TPA: hypothetical protein [Caudoviricetes sp.]
MCKIIRFERRYKKEHFLNLFAVIDFYFSEFNTI